MHFAKSYHNLFIVDFVNNAFNPTTLAAFVVSIALVEAYDITWWENSQFHLILVSILAFFSSGALWQRATFFCPSCQVEKNTSVYTRSYVFDKQFSNCQVALL